MSSPAAQSAGARPAVPPRYVTVLNALRQDVVRGIYPVGTRLPPEEQLCAAFGVSRHTVREALRRLREEGLVSSRQGAGTTVARASRSATYAPEISSVADLVAFSTGTRLEVDSTAMVTCDEALAARLGTQPGQSWLRVTGLRHENEDGPPICWVEVYIAAPYAGVGRILPRHPGPIFELIESLYGESVAQVQQELTARRSEPREAAALGIAEDATVIQLRRSYRLQSGPVCEVAFNVHPIERFRMTITLNRLKTYGTKPMAR